MHHKEKVKYVQDVDASPTAVAVRKPFTLEQQESRRFIRLEISSPMSLQKIKDAGGYFVPEGDWHTINGLILNISAGGVLVETDQLLQEGDVVSMCFTLQDVERIDNILGLVKRCDHTDDIFLSGIEFISRRHLEDLFAQSELDLLPKSLSNFSQSVTRVLDKYVTRQRLSGEGA
jgi:hypothetical protein